MGTSSPWVLPTSARRRSRRSDDSPATAAVLLFQSIKQALLQHLAANEPRNSLQTMKSSLAFATRAQTSNIVCPQTLSGNFISDGSITFQSVEVRFCRSEACFCALGGGESWNLSQRLRSEALWAPKIIPNLQNLPVRCAGAGVA